MNGIFSKNSINAVLLDVSVIILECLDLEDSLLCSLDTFSASLGSSHGRDVRNMLADGILTDVGVIVRRGLSCRCVYLSSPSTLKDDYAFYAQIGSQNDKLIQAVEAFDDIINNMPVSDSGFDIAKSNVESTIRTERYVGVAALNSYLSARDLGLTEPLVKTVFESLGDLDLDKLVATQQKWIKDRTYVYGLLGDPADLDQDFLKTLGPVNLLTLEDIFGY